MRSFSEKADNWGPVLGVPVELPAQASDDELAQTATGHEKQAGSEIKKAVDDIKGSLSKTAKHTGQKVKRSGSKANDRLESGGAKRKAK
jgi:hypothetical protein